VTLALSVLGVACGGSDGVGGGPVTAAVHTPGLPSTYTDPDGLTTEITSAARIVSLSGDFSEIVWELGLGDNLVAVDLSSVYPKEEMRFLPKIGVEFRLFAEPILAAEPTVVIGDSDARPPEVIEQLREAGVPVVIFPSRFGLDAPAVKIREVAAVLGVPERGEALATTVQAEIDDAVALATGAVGTPAVTLLYIASDDTFLLLGRNTAAEGMLAAAGADDVGPEAGSGSPFVPLTPEALAGAAPDVIITAERGFNEVGGLEGFLELPGVAQTPAAATGSVLVYEDLYLLGLGPRTGQALREIVLDLHPELSDG